MIDRGLYRVVGKSALSRYSVYAANLFSMMLLARMFGPEMFGIVGAITVFFTFFLLVSEGGLAPAVINLTHLNEADRDGIFGLTIVVGALFAFVFILLGQSFEEFYRIERVAEIVPYIGVTIFFVTVSIVPSAMLLRDQLFMYHALAAFIATVVSTLSTAGLAYVIDPLHALASKELVFALVNCVLVYSFSRKTEWGRPIPGLKFAAINLLLSFSRYQFGFNIINYFSRNLDNILVARNMGAPALGVYEKAYSIMRYPLMLLTFAMTPAIQPYIRKYRADKLAVAKSHVRFISRLSLMGSVCGVVVYVLSEQIVALLLGDGWSEVSPIIRILSLSIPVQVVLSTSGSFFQAMNRPDLLFLSGALSAIVTVAAIIYGVYMKDILLLSWCLVVAFHINFFQAYYILVKMVFESSLRDFFVAVLPAAIVVCVLVLSAIFIELINGIG